MSLDIDWEYDNGNLRINDRLFPVREWCQYWQMGFRSKLVEEGYTFEQIREIHDLVEWLAEEEERVDMELIRLQEEKVIAGALT